MTTDGRKDKVAGSQSLAAGQLHRFSNRAS